MPEVLTAANGNRPAILLDIDGVLQLYADTTAQAFVPNPEVRWLAYNPLHGNWLRQQQSIADLYYISDWREQSHNIIGQHLGLAELDWVNTDPYRPQAKSVSMARALAITALFGKQSIVWIDDEIGTDEYIWARQRQAHGAPTLIVKTESEAGLRTDQMDKISAWLREAVLTH